MTTLEEAMMNPLLSTIKAELAAGRDVIVTGLDEPQLKALAKFYDTRNPEITARVKPLDYPISAVTTEYELKIYAGDKERRNNSSV